MSDIDALIEERIRDFIDELRTLLREAALEAVREALGGSEGSVERKDRGGTRLPKERAPRAKARPKHRADGQQSNGRRTAEEIAGVAARVRRHIEQTPGQTIEQIALALGMPTQALTRPVSKLLESRQVRKTGLKRQTKYYPVSEKSSQPKPSRRKTTK